MVYVVLIETAYGTQVRLFATQAKALASVTEYIVNCRVPIRDGFVQDNYRLMWSHPNGTDIKIVTRDVE